MDKEKESENLQLSSDEVAMRVGLLTDLLQCGTQMVVSTYTVSGTLLTTNAKHAIYDTLFRSSGRLDEAIALGRENSGPLIITTKYGLMWSVIYEQDEDAEADLLYTLGPVLSSPLMEETIADILKNPQIRASWKPKFIRYLKAIKTIPVPEFFRDTMMLHYCVTGRYIKASEMTFQSFEEPDDASSGRRGNYADFFAFESGIINYIRTGDIHYKEKIPSASSTLHLFEAIIGESIPVARQYATVFCGHCIQAAIEGGISPDSAYTKSAIYLKNLTIATTNAEIMQVCHCLFEDLLFQVHNHKGRPAWSKEIVACTDYIDAHPCEKLGIDLLADRIGYSRYYLSKKFKTETGMSINSYIKKSRIEHASYLLVTTRMSIDDISEQLHFGNRNFFSKVFKDETGSSPAQFREAHRHF